jgi:transcriptional regulator with XRE-family HTH domain
VSPLRKQFGKRLRAIRKSRGMTQEELAELLDISIDFLSNMERGVRPGCVETVLQTTPSRTTDRWI